jgi:hypothetical protein
MSLADEAEMWLILSISTTFLFFMTYTVTVLALGCNSRRIKFC